MFRSSRPVTEAAFFDREEALARLSRVVDRLAAGDPEWLAIIGARKVGKTSLLLEAARRFARGEVAFAVFDVLETMPMGLEVFRRLSGSVLDVVLGEQAGASLARLLARPADFRAALVRARRFGRLPTELQTQLLELPERPADESLVRDAIELPEALARATGMKLLVAIDEFQELAGLGSRRGIADPLPLMRSRWQRHERVAYVISGSARSTLLELVTAEHSPFFQHFALLELGGFSHRDAVNLLVKAAPPECPVSRELAERAVGVLGGHPFYLQLFGEALAAVEPPYDESALKEALQSTLFSHTGRLSLFFQNVEQRIVGSSTGLAATLDALAPSPRTLTEVARAIGGSTGTAHQYLKRLGDAVRSDEHGRHHLADPVFGMWLRWRTPGGAAVPMKVIGDEAEAAVAEHLATMGFDLVYFSRGSRGAFDLMAIRGADQLGVQVKRSPLPLRFGKAAWTRMVADAKRWGWKWIVAAVAEDGTISLLDPANAWKRKEVRVGDRARIDNLLAWLD